MSRTLKRIITLPLCIIGFCLSLALLSLYSQAAPQSSDASATVISSTRLGAGLAYQALYEISRTDSLNRTATWIGNLQALHLDSHGNFREDGNGDGILQENDYVNDPAVRIFVDTTDHSSKLARFRFAITAETSSNAGAEIRPLSDLHPLWSAGKQLAMMNDVTTQRPYSSAADTGRRLLTYLDLNTNGLVDPGEVQDFVPATFDVGRYGILDVADVATARKLINFIRGDESQNSDRNLRNRTLDIDGDGNPEVMRLGDIINSIPVAVGTPAEAFDLLYGDTSYGAFRARYAHRRNVIYVGANDGMIHAFNAGFYNAKAKSHDLQGKNAETPHPLGSELWAYIPYNLLSYLKALQSKNYEHMSYMDGKPRVFDARIFPADSVHPGGWGTVLVMGMRRGGSPIKLKASDDPKALSAFTSDDAAITTLTQRSAYVVMDITDPEREPTLIAEITDPTGNMGFTTSTPALAAFSIATNKTPHTSNKWYLIFGSGPASNPATTGSAKLYLYDLANRTFIKSGSNTYFHDLGDNENTGAPNSSVGDPVAVDWDMNFKADVLYFGTIGDNPGRVTGKLFKLDFNPGQIADAETSTPAMWTAPTVLTNPDNPVAFAPVVTKDESGNRWVLAGTGHSDAEINISNSQTQSLFGVIDTLPAVASNYDKLLDVSKVKVSSSGAVQNIAGAKTQNELVKLVPSHKGWKRNLSPGERSVNPMLLFGDTLFATTFTPGNANTTGNGSSKLYCLYYKTGTANAQLGSCGKSAGAKNSNKDDTILDAVSLGDGIAVTPLLHSSNNANEKQTIVMTQSSTGAISQTAITVAPAAVSGEIDWREIHP